MVGMDDEKVHRPVPHPHPLLGRRVGLGPGLPSRSPTVAALAALRKTPMRRYHQRHLSDTFSALSLGRKTTEAPKANIKMGDNSNKNAPDGCGVGKGEVKGGGEAERGQTGDKHVYLVDQHLKHLHTDHVTSPLSAAGENVTSSHSASGQHMTGHNGSAAAARTSGAGSAAPLPPLKLGPSSPPGVHRHRSPNAGVHMQHSRSNLLIPGQLEARTTDQSGSITVSVTMLDTAQSSPQRASMQQDSCNKVAEADPLPAKPHMGFLFDTDKDLSKFRQLLRQSTNSSIYDHLGERRINYCNEEKSKLIEDWLNSVYKAHCHGDKWTDTINDIADDDLCPQYA